MFPTAANVVLSFWCLWKWDGFKNAVTIRRVCTDNVFRMRTLLSEMSLSIIALMLASAQSNTHSRHLWVHVLAAVL